MYYNAIVLDPVVLSIQAMFYLNDSQASSSTSPLLETPSTIKHSVDKKKNSRHWKLTNVKKFFYLH